MKSASRPSTPLNVLVAFLLIAPLCSAQVENAFQYRVDLIHIVNDQVKVELIVPDQFATTAEFYFPKTVPGTYATLDYGRLISGFTAKDGAGNVLKVKQIRFNTFRIENAGKLHRISYLVDDSYDAGLKKNKTFEPAGTNIEAGKNVLMNPGGFFGCLKGSELNPVNISVVHPDDFYTATSLRKEEEKPGFSKFTAIDYRDLIDNPLMFSKPDTSGFTIKNTRVSIAVYCPATDSVAGSIKEGLRSSMAAIGDFFEVLPADHYTFIFYLVDLSPLFEKVKGPFPKLKLIARFLPLVNQAFGALEHGHSSVYYLPYVSEIKEPMLLPLKNELDLNKMIREVAIHEFLHILTPLSLHSREIGEFDFLTPRMSRHLWMYEGSTEYHAGLIQLQGGLINRSEYASGILREKITTASKYPATRMPITVMSRRVLNNKYHRQYDYVYSYGALLGLMLDIEIIRLTDGQKRLKTVLLDLSTRYGKDRYFDDETFIDEFIAEVHPDLRNFFDRYVTGKKRIDLDPLHEIGFAFHRRGKFDFPKHYLADNDVKTRPVSGGTQIVEVGKNDFVGFQKSDVIPARVTFNSIYGQTDGPIAVGKLTSIPVLREGRQISLEFKVAYKKIRRKNYVEVIRPDEQANPKLARTWLEL